MENSSTIQERLYINVYDPSGKLVDHRETYIGTPWQRFKKWLGLSKCYSNDLILDHCLQDIAAYLITRYTYISVGVGDTTPAHDDDTLETEILSRSEATSSIGTTFYTNDTAIFSGTFTPGYDVTIYESGLHKESTSSIDDRMAARETFQPITIPGGYPFTVQWNIIVMR